MQNYTLIRSNRKTLAFEIDRSGALIVRAPRRLPKTEIDRLVAARAGWIAEKQRLMRDRAAALLPAGAGETVWYLGKVYRLQDGDSAEPELRDDCLLPPRGWTAAQVRAWFKQSCRRELAARLPLLSQRTGLVPRGVHVTEARTRWGSCSGKDSLNFAWRLVFCPPDVMEYVILHELCHIRHKNHSAAFWALVAQADPLFEQHKSWLRDHAGLMDLLR